MDYLYTDLSRKVIGLAMKIHRDLGPGYLEKIYEKALVNALRKEGIMAVCQVPLEVVYDDEVLGHYVADIVVDGKMILELKAIEGLTNKHKAQVISYLKTTGYLVGLLMNFGSDSLQYKRYVNKGEIERLELRNIT